MPSSSRFRLFPVGWALPTILLCAMVVVFSITSPTLAQETDQDMPVGAMGGSVHADLFTGTATTSIPIEVPPGRGGVQPSLALVYGSANGNGWIGMGWKLEKGVIERQTKHGVDYSGDDYVFRLSGINVELVNIGNDEYRAKIEGGFTKVEKLTATDGKPYFLATDKTGKKFYFGQEANTRVVDPADATRIFRWCLDRVEDTNGNYMTLTYTSDRGQSYQARVDYTGHGATVPSNSVIFHLEDRPDVTSMYVPNFEMTTAKRLKTIEVQANSGLVRAYALNYTLSGNTSRSLLDSVQQFGKDSNIDGTGSISGGLTQPAVGISYVINTNGFEVPTTLWLGNNGGPNGAQTYQPSAGYHFVGDFNGDGKNDYLYNYGGWHVALANSTGFDTPTLWLGNNGGPNGAQTYQPSAGYHFVGDFNGDGKSDFLYNYAGWHVALANGTGFDAPTLWLGNNGGPTGAQTYQPSTGYHFVGDFNGDGKSDFLYNYAGWHVALANGTGFDAPTLWLGNNGGPNGAQTHQPSAGYHFLGDFNGDGKSDFLYNYAGWHVALANGTGFDAPTLWLGNNGGPNGAQTYQPSAGYHFVGDFNGDGKNDYLYNYAGWHVALAIGSGFDAPTLWLGNNGGPNGAQTFNPNNPLIYHLLGDFNGDGKSDLLYNYGGWHVALANGSGLDTPILWLGNNDGPNGGLTYNSSAPPRYHFVGDFNGDGKGDFLYNNGGWHMAQLYGMSDLLASLSNGLGATTSIEYTPSTEYTNTQLPFPVQTVSKITTDDGNGNVASTTYEYDGGFHHIGERDFRGFNHVKVIGQAGPSGEQAISETWFHQGNDIAVDVNDPNVADGYLKGAPYRTKVTDGAGNLYTETTTTYVADADGQAPFFTPPASVVTSICDGNGCGKETRTDFTYDIYGNVTEELQYGDTGDSSDDRTVVRTFTPNTTDWLLSLPSSETIYAGLGTGGTQMAQTDFYYDGTASCSVASTNQLPIVGNLTRVVRWLSGGTSPETRMAYDSMGNVTCTRDALGNTTTIAYDPSGTFATSVTNASGHVTSTTYYGVNGVAMDLGLYGQVKTVTDPNNAVVLAEYDALGRRTKVTQPDGFWTTTSYVSFGTVGTQHVKTDSQLGLSTWSYFDGLGRTIKSKSTGTDSNISVTETEYDARGAVTRSSTPYFETGGTPLWSTSIYDAMGRVVQATAPDGTRGLSCHDDWVSVTIDANDHKKRTTRDAYGRVQTVHEYTGTFTTCDTAVGTPYATTTYAYDGLGNLQTLTDAKGNQSTMQYDTLSRKTTMHDPDMGDWTYQYDANGNLTLQTDAKTQQIHFQYDALNRRVQKDYGTQKTLGSGDVVYTYDGTIDNRTGRLQQVNDASGTTIFYYDITGRVTKTDKIVDSTTYTTQSAYDALGRVTSLTYPDTSTVTQTYNGPQLQSVQEGPTTYARYSGFNALGQPDKLTLGNGVVTDYTYDAQNFRLKTLKTVNGATVLQDLGYTFDDGGNVTTLTDTVHGTQTFNYDDLDRLTSATGGYGTLTYSYNEIGNMLSNTQLGTYGYSPSGSGSVRPHAVTSAGTNIYTYDANGNMILDIDRSLTYDFENRLDSVTKNSVTTTFTYDGDGGRVKKSDGTTTTTYIGKLYVCEGSTPSLSCVKFIYSGGQRIAMKQVTSGSTSYFHADHLGSTSVLTNAAGVAEEHNTYLPYGDTHTHTGTSDVAYKYTGKERDTTTGLYFYEARYYDPVLGRFISPDRIVQGPTDPQSLNRYAYARNNPIAYNDPTGNFFSSIFKFISKIISPATDFLFNIRNIISPITIIADPLLKSSSIVRAVAFAAASYFGGPAGAAGFSAYTTKLDGGSTENALKAAVITYATAKAFEAIELTGLSDVEKIVGHGIVGGTSAELQGGKFQYGFVVAAGARTLKAGWEWARDTTNASSSESGNKSKCFGGPCTFAERPNIKTGTCEAALCEFSKSDPTKPGSFFGTLFVFDAVSKVHDVMQQAVGKYQGGYYVPYGNPIAETAFNLGYNIPTMVPAAAFTGAAFTSGTPLVVDISKEIE